MTGMSTIRVPPGRAGRLWLRARLDVAERGVSLLEQKVRILGDERRRLRALTEDTGRDWERGLPRCPHLDTAGHLARRTAFDPTRNPRQPGNGHRDLDDNHGHPLPGRR